MNNFKIFPSIIFPGYFGAYDGSIWTIWNLEGYAGEPRRLNESLRGGTDKNDRYLSVNISLKNDDGSTSKQIKYYSHKFIAETLIPNPNNLPECNHKNRNKKDNRVENIEWSDRQSNMDHLAETYNDPIPPTPSFYEGTPIIDHIPDNWVLYEKPEKQTKPPRFLVKDLIRKENFKVISMTKWVNDNWNYISTRTNSKDPKKFYSLLMVYRNHSGYEVERILRGKLDKPWLYKKMNS